MARMIKVPDRHKEAILAILHIGKEERSQILAHLERLDHPPRPKEISGLFLGQFPKMPEKTAEDIASLLISLHAALDQPDRPTAIGPAELINAVVRKVKESGSDVADDDLESLREFFKSVLEMRDSVGLRAKAYRLLSRQQHIYDSSEIYTDVRPVFRADNPKIRPNAAVLVHTLMINYYDGNSKKSFYCALDYDDLKRLNHAIERALAKHENLSEMLADFGMLCLDLEEDE